MIEILINKIENESKNHIKLKLVGFKEFFVNFYMNIVYEQFIQFRRRCIQESQFASAITFLSDPHFCLQSLLGRSLVHLVSFVIRIILIRIFYRSRSFISSTSNLI